MVNSPIADGYLLSRVLKDFDINKRKKRGFDEPHNVIIYGCDLHVNRCRKFLENIKFKRIEQNDDCVYYKGRYISIKRLF